MRFTADGPDIPSHLLEQQALGNVIFFCGAGVSIPAGLDSFWELTDRIVTSLDCREARRCLDEGVDFDRVFGLLSKIYGRPELDRQIYQALGTKRAKTLAHHRAILRLSKGAAGTTQLVTTNFDLLFERAGFRAPLVIPPNLPNLEINRSINGIVYLHGRLADPSGRVPANYVISSADFGRAYLAEGWATKFVKELRERFTLVFLGYRADDPPMRYLLEGLNDREGVVYENPIYAFAANSNDDAFETWNDRGVTPIGYSPSPTHSSLWNTIEAWSVATSNTQSWIEDVIALAQAGPRKLAPYQRGQVVELVSTTKGAAAFADAKPPISAEWLCVFDPNARYGKPGRQHWEEGAEEIDPQDLYGLDSDSPRPPASANRLYPEGTQNPLAWRSGDGELSNQTTLQGAFHVYANRLPARLHNLARWFGAICDQPAAIWWASGWTTLNQHLLWFVARRLRDRQGGAMAPPAVHYWSFYLEHSASFTLDEQEYRWFEFEGLVKVSGWNNHALRYLERCVRPTVAAKRPLLSAPRPPEGDWSRLALREVCELEVRVLDRHNTKLSIPPEILPKVIQILRSSLVRMVELLDEVDNKFWTPPNLHPSDRPGERYYGKKEQFVLWFADLFKILSNKDCSCARQEWEHWPVKDDRLFPKLRVWAASLPGLLSNAEAFALLMNLSQQTFWSSDEQRGVMLLLKQKWGQFDARMRRALERRLEAGPPRWPHQTDKEFKLRSAAHAASRLRWLELQGCALSPAATKKLNRLKVVDKRWTDRWAESADDSMGPRGGMISQITDPQGLEVYPVDEIVSKAAHLTRENIDELRHYRPFRGLVESHPFTALSSLRRALKGGEFPEQFWIDLLSAWPKGTSLRLRILLGYTVAGLPPDKYLNLRYYTAEWLKANLKLLHRLRPEKALELFDAFLRPFFSASAAMTSSSLGETTFAGEVQRTSEVSINKAINSPVGMMCEALWKLTPPKAHAYGRPAPDLEVRFCRLASVPGDGAGHAVAILTQRLGWIVYCYGDWAREFILPMFEPSHPLSEAAWHGLVYNGNPLPAEIWTALRAPLQDVVAGDVPWPFDDEAKRAMLDAMVWLSDPEREGGAIFNFAELRNVLRRVDDEGRGHALWTLGNILEGGDKWTVFVQPFIEQAWPREKRFRSEQATRGFLRIAEQAGSHFPDAVKAVKPFLRPVPHADIFTYRLSRESEEKSSARQHPLEAIQLLDSITGDDRVTMPYGLAEALDALGDADPRVRETSEFRRLSALAE